MPTSGDAETSTIDQGPAGVRLFKFDSLVPDKVEVHKTPFPFFVAHDQLPEELAGTLHDHFVNHSGAGYLPHEEEQCSDLVNALVTSMTSNEFSNAVGGLLGIENLAQFPTMVSISNKLNKRHGTIHTDGKSKVATVLMYLNPTWNSSSDGCLRFLNRIDDIEDTVIPEIPPVYGTLAGFKRCDNSFHGHLPFEGERHVIQVAWIINEEEKQRKMQRGGLSRIFKKLLGAIDRRLGSGRDKSSSHSR